MLQVETGWAGRAGRAVCRMACGLLLICSAPAAAAAAPLWEFGVGLTAIGFPAYRGASHYRHYLLPLPYMVYRGQHLRVDREGMRGVLVDHRRLELDLSFGGGLPVRSGNIPERRDMPDLDPVLELGPSLEYRLSDPDARLQWKLQLPLRSAFSVGSGIDHVGWVAHPRLVLGWPNAIAGWSLGLSAGPVFGDDRYHAYYYGVSTAHAQPWRPAYQARSGYGGSTLQLGLGRRRGALVIGAFLRYDNLDGAVFQDSPLVDSRHGVMAGIAVAWLLQQSSRTVSAGKAPADSESR